MGPRNLLWVGLAIMATSSSFAVNLNEVENMKVNNLNPKP